MAETYRVLTENDHKAIAALIRDHNLIPYNRRAGIGRSHNQLAEEEIQTTDIYIARAPAGGISAVSISTGTGTGTGTPYYPGTATCAIYKLSTVNNRLSIRPVGGLDRVVYNISGCAIAARSWVIIVKEKFGNWITVEPCPASASSTTTTSTTTRPERCTGSCEWRCEGITLGTGTGTSYDIREWVLYVDGCRDRTGTGTGTGTGTSEECNCVEPVFCCGSCGEPAEVTYTQCIRGTPTAQQPDCSTTTTSTTSTTSTTQPVICTGCTYWCFGGEWHLNDNNCDTASGCLDCEPPTTACTDECLLEITACDVPTTTTPPVVSECSGNCIWSCDLDYEWILNDNSSCSYTLGYNCFCAYPSEDCTTCNSILYMECIHIDDGPIPGPGTTTTTQPRPTTTTSSGCGGQCRWQWSVDSNDWVFKCTTCQSFCHCAMKPGYDGEVDKQVALVPCSSTTTTTTSTTTTTTSTTTTTTTTACGSCDWVCFAYLIEGYSAWQLLLSTCTGDCTCGPPTVPCATNGDLANTTCRTTTTTTTTTSTTTSTTTTCTTTVPAAPSCGTCTWYKPIGGDCETWVLFADACVSCDCSAPSCTPEAFGCIAPSTLSVQTNCIATTTTPTGCGECTYSWSSMGASWSYVSDTCTGICSCLTPPIGSGTVDGELTQVACEEPA